LLLFHRGIEFTGEGGVEDHIFKHAEEERFQECTVRQFRVEFREVANGCCFSDTEKVRVDEDFFPLQPVDEFVCFRCIKLDVAHGAVAHQMAADNHMRWCANWVRVIRNREVFLNSSSDVGTMS